jgi:hypothetical protein
VAEIKKPNENLTCSFQFHSRYYAIICPIADSLADSRCRNQRVDSLIGLLTKATWRNGGVTEVGNFERHVDEIAWRLEASNMAAVE